MKKGKVWGSAELQRAENGAEMVMFMDTYVVRPHRHRVSRDLEPN